MKELSDLYEDIINGNALLIAGSGFSYGATIINNEKIPSVKTLSVIMQEEILKKKIEPENKEEAENRPITEVSQRYINEFGEQSLVNLIKEKFTVKQITDTQKDFGKYNWGTIYTTNYDNVLEQAFLENNIKLNGLDLSNSPEDNRGETKKTIYHLNGYVETITKSNINSSSKLTKKSYIKDNLYESPWINKIKSEISFSKKIVVVGLSLIYDLDISRLIGEDDRNKEKTFFINGKDMISEWDKPSYEEMGHILNLGAEEFIAELNSFSNSYDPPRLLENKETYSLKKVEKKLPENRPVRDKDVANLFFKGEFNSDLAEQQYLTRTNNYIFDRDVMQDVDKFIDSEKIKIMILESNLGNGKTVLVKMIESKYVNLNYQVFTFNGNPNSIKQDIDIINNIQSTNPIIIIIDDYYSIKSEFKYFNDLKKENLKVILTGRSSINANNIKDFQKKGNYSDEEVIEKSLDRISERERENLFKIVDEHNLWGKATRYNTNRKKQYLKQISKGGTSQTVYELIKSNDILERINSLMTPDALNKEYQEIILLSLINNILELQLYPQQILQLLSKEGVSKNFLNNSNLKEFLDFKSDRIKIKSSIISKDIIKNYKDKKFITEVLIKSFKRADATDYQSTYNYFKRQLVSFSNLNMIFGNISHTSKAEVIMDFYENIKNSSFAKRNPFFWLQYAIQKIDSREFDLAKIYFDNAYSLSEKLNHFDNFQIDTHKGRFLLEKNLYYNENELKQNKDEAFLEFIEADKIFLKSIKNIKNDPYYVLKQVFLYEKFYNLYSPFFIEDDIKRFMLIITIMQQEIQKYINKNENISRNIRKSEKSLQKIHSQIIKSVI